MSQKKKLNEINLIVFEIKAIFGSEKIFQILSLFGFFLFKISPDFCF